MGGGVVIVKLDFIYFLDEQIQKLFPVPVTKSMKLKEWATPKTGGGEGGPGWTLLGPWSPSPHTLRTLNCSK